MNDATPRATVAAVRGGADTANREPCDPGTVTVIQLKHRAAAIMTDGDSAGLAESFKVRLRALWCAMGLPPENSALVPVAVAGAFLEVVARLKVEIASPDADNPEAVDNDPFEHTHVSNAAMAARASAPYVPAWEKLGFPVEQPPTRRASEIPAWPAPTTTRSARRHDRGSL
jgi:hypothetical protein